MSNDDLGPDELDHASAPSYSSRWVVDEWCRRLAAEVRRHRRSTPPPAAPLLAPEEREALEWARDEAADAAFAHPHAGDAERRRKVLDILLERLGGTATPPADDDVSTELERWALTIYCPQCGVEPESKCCEIDGHGGAEFLDEAHYIRVTAAQVYWQRNKAAPRAHCPSIPVDGGAGVDASRGEERSEVDRAYDIRRDRLLSHRGRRPALSHTAEPRPQQRVALHQAVARGSRRHLHPRRPPAREGLQGAPAVNLTEDQRSTLWRAVLLEERFDAGMFPNGAGSHAHFRKLERIGLLVFDGWGRDIDGEVERDVMCYRLTEEGRRAVKMFPPGVPAPDPVKHPDLDLLSVSHWPCDDGGRWCPGCRLFAWAKKQSPGADRYTLTATAWSLLASNLVGPGDMP